MNKSIVLYELKFKAVRSSGAGGQHVNKVSSKVELYFNIDTSNGLHQNEKILLEIKLKSRLTKENILILSCQESRSQHKNKGLVIDSFFKLLKKELTPKKPRRKTKPTLSSKNKRLNNKKENAEKKENRKKPKF